ncbi:putative receptor-like protein kinase, partial [Nymphaea thermarum]
HNWLCEPQQPIVVGFCALILDFLEWNLLRRFGSMGCFQFSSREKKEERKSGKSGSGSTHYNSGGSTDHEQRGSGSEFNSLNTSDVSGDSSGRSMFPSFSQRPCSNLRVLSFSELKAATKNFSRSLMVGEGGFGCVYKGSLRSLDDPSSRLEVAVKQLNRKGLQGHKEWITEVNVLGVVEHPNLVKLIGYCADDDERGIQRLLVYEFMPNGSVEYHLSPRTPMPLPWSKRLTIALDAARGLTYLHEGMDFQIIFRDLKTSNILLDEQWNAKLSDFGLARQGPGEGLSHVSTAVVGTIGYAAPEYLQTGRLTAKSDIWSFGVVLYELITGRRPVDRNRPKSEQKVLEWVRPYISDSKKFHMIIDPRINGQYKLKTVQKLAAVANRCLVRQPKARPKMSEVLEMIKQIVETSEAMNPDSDMGNSSMNSHGSQSSCEMASSDNALDAKIMENGRSPLRMWMPKLIWSC